MKEFVPYVHRDPARYTEPEPVEEEVRPSTTWLGRIDPDAVCGRGCCWNQFGVCPLERRCGCHRMHKPAEPVLDDGRYIIKWAA